MLYVRPATVEDLPTLLQFEQGVIEAERPYDSTLIPDPIKYYDLQYLLDDPESYLVVVIDNHLLIASGYATIRNAKPFYAYDQYAYLGFMYVLPDYRGQGVNLMILEALKKWCVTKDIRELRLEVYSDNLPAIKAYEKAGFFKDLITMGTHI